MLIARRPPLIVPERRIIRPGPLRRPRRNWPHDPPLFAPTNAVTRVQTATPTQSGTAATTLTISFASNTAVGNHIVVLLGWSGGVGITVTVADAAGNTYTVHQQTGTGGSTGTYTGIASCKITTQLNAAANITMTISSSQTHRLMHAAEYSGLDTTAWIDGNTGATATSAAPASGAITTTATGLVVGCCHYGSGTQSHASTGGFTEVAEVSTTAKSLSWHEQINVAAGSYNDTGTITSALWTDSVAGFKAAAAGGGPAFRQRKTLMGVGQ